MKNLMFSLNVLLFILSHISAATGKYKVKHSIHTL